MILVTGATGMVGAQLIFDLTAGGQKVRAMCRSTSKMDVVNRIFSADLSRLNNVEWVTGDVNDIFSIEDALEGVETVYHTAALISFHASDLARMNHVNVDGTANMVNMAMEKKVKRFCHVSSVAAIGRAAGNSAVTETSVWKTSKENSNYAISKYAGEREVWRAIEEGLPAFIVNPTIIIGPGDWNLGSTQMFSSVAKGLKFYATGSTGFVDVRDVSKAAIQLNAKGIVGQRYILNAENLPYKTVFNTIARELGKPEATIKVTPLMGEIGWRLEGVKSFLLGKKSLITRETVRNGGMDWEYSNTKICKELGFSFIPIAQSVKDTAKHFLVA
ncbi:MAG: NAD-dependent epimerase/dehydratase family protein [Bacteroidetes bacterium]|nr:NAD-dependent epimerase/dehydratase family protein [Bacteroidota bacterium]